MHLSTHGPNWICVRIFEASNAEERGREGNLRDECAAKQVFCSRSLAYILMKDLHYRSRQMRERSSLGAEDLCLDEPVVEV